MDPIRVSHGATAVAASDHRASSSSRSAARRRLGGAALTNRSAPTTSMGTRKRRDDLPVVGVRRRGLRCAGPAMFATSTATDLGRRSEGETLNPARGRPAVGCDPSEGGYSVAVAVLTVRGQSQRARAKQVGFSNRATVRFRERAPRYGPEGVLAGGRSTNTSPMAFKWICRCRRDAVQDAEAGACGAAGTRLRLLSCAAEGHEGPDSLRRRVNRVRDA